MKFYDLSLEEITEEIVWNVITENIQKKNFVITPLSVLGFTGFPIAEQKVVLENKSKIKKIKQILEILETKGILEKRKSKQDFKGIKETGYNYIKTK